MVRKVFLRRAAFFLVILFAAVALNILDPRVGLAVPIQEPTQGAQTRAATVVPPIGNLKYRNGPVVRLPQTTYNIFWIPSGYSVSNRYQSLLNRFLIDVAADSGKTTNVYHSATQYAEPNGSVVYQTTFGGSVVDSSPFPVAGCTMPNVATCLNDEQMQDKLKQITAAQGWTPGMNKIFFVYLPQNVGSCYNNNSTFCLQRDYCAYHNSFVANNNTYLYGVMGYAGDNLTRCGSFSHPNGDPADSTINLLAHEHNELLTDPLNNAWLDDSNKERGDRCAWQFGAALGWTAYGKYNQLINGNKYYLQSMWSNATSRCVLSGM